MSIIRTSHDKNNPYVMLNKTALEDPDLSWAAKGLWAYLISRPDNWQISVNHLSKIYNEKGGGEKSILNILKELIEKGYCSKNQPKKEKGFFAKLEYIVYEFKIILPQRPERRAVERVAVERIAVEDPPNNKGCINNKEKQQQQAAASLVFECLAAIDIPEVDKAWLSANHTEREVQYAIAWATHPETKIKTTLSKAIKWAAKQKPDIPISPQDLSEDNRSKGLKMAKIAILPHDVYIEVLNRGIEIGYRIGQNIPDFIRYDENGFLQQLEKYIRKYGGNLKKGL